MKQFLQILLVFISTAVIAQENNKIPLSLVLQTADYPSGQLISVLVEGNPVAVEDAVKRHGGFLMYSQGTISSVQLPCGNLTAFAAENAIVRIGNSPINQQVLNDTMKRQTGVLDVRNGLAPLPQGYTGAGVIMGIIDSGIDFNHPDFKDAQGNTRIYRLWDQRDQGGPSPMPWNYGTAWDSAAINGGTCTHNDLQYYGHGTHISGIAAGNGNSTALLDMSGVAPQAMYVVVALDFNGTFSATAVADAAAYIYSVANALSMPCVINASVGDYYGSHDGQDLQALMIDTLLNTPGRLFVGAAGNAGGLPIHMSYQLSSDTNFTWFNTSNGSIYIQMWADTNNFNGADFAIGATRMSDLVDIDRTGFTDIASNLPGITNDTLYNSLGQRIAIVRRAASIQGSAYSMEFIVTPDSLSGYNYGLYNTGSGLFHLWSFEMASGPFPTVGQYPAIAYYEDADLTHNIVSSFQCSDRVICVGNYVNRDTWPNYSGTWTVDTTVTAGELMYNSSVGPTRDGRIKPEITAPGANDVSCIETNSMAAIIAGAPQAVAPGGYHVVGGGTSASSPVVAGTGALWLERFPNATWQQFHAAVIYCAKQDSFTGTALPNSDWGYGKIDAYSMMANCATSMSVETPEVNSGIVVYPVPADQSQPITLQLQASEMNAVVEIYNAAGQLVFTGTTGSDGKLVVPAGILSSGMYNAVANGNEGVATSRFIIQ